MGIIKGVLGLSLLVFLSCSSSQKDGLKIESEPKVEVVIAQPLSLNSSVINLSGQIEGSRKATLGTRIMGLITKVYVKLGDPVLKGQLLVSISNQDLQAKKGQIEASISTAQAGLVNARKDLDRFTILAKQNSATPKELENITLQYKAAISQLDAAIQMRKEIDANLEYSRLTAPFSGKVIQKLANEGSLASPGTPILTIEQIGSYQVNATVPENLINQIHLGDQAIVDIQSANKILKGTITQINSSSEFSGGQYIIKISLPQDSKKELRSGMYANISIDKKKIDHGNNSIHSVLVPVSSIIHKEELDGIYTLGNNKTALLRWVRLGKTYGDQIEILSGLEKSESFIVHANGKLYDGAPIQVK